MTFGACACWEISMLFIRSVEAHAIFLQAAMFVGILFYANVLIVTIQLAISRVNNMEESV